MVYLYPGTAQNQHAKKTKKQCAALVTYNHLLNSLRVNQESVQVNQTGVGRIKDCALIGLLHFLVGKQLVIPLWQNRLFSSGHISWQASVYTDRASDSCSHKNMAYFRVVRLYTRTSMSNWELLCTLHTSWQVCFHQLPLLQTLQALAPFPVLVLMVL